MYEFNFFLDIFVNVLMEYRALIIFVVLGIKST